MAEMRRGIGRRLEQLLALLAAPQAVVVVAAPSLYSSRDSRQPAALDLLQVQNLATQTLDTSRPLRMEAPAPPNLGAKPLDQRRQMRPLPLPCAH